MLSKLGFQVEKAVDGEEALEKVQAVQSRPDHPGQHHAQAIRVGSDADAQA